MNHQPTLKFVLTVCLMGGSLLQAQPFSSAEISRWKQQAQQVTIISDKWGIPHVYGKSDADAVFGLLYAQCEDDFQRVEANYIEKLGRKAEIEGSGALYEDLLHRLVLDSAAAKADYNQAPVWMKKLCQAFADGVNYFLYTHRSTKPALLTRFEPWWPMMWTDGSIGAISTGGASLSEIAGFYGGNQVAASPMHYPTENHIGSNGFAFAPSRTASGKAILYINPHVTFYFRPEVHVVSEEGLNAYGAVTWGQFFIYQGFNAHCGWMHTSSQADVADLYEIEAQEENGVKYYAFDGGRRKIEERETVLQTKDGTAQRFRTYFTHHGPIVAARQGKLLALKHQNRSAKGLEQSWLRTKANSFDAFKKIMYLKENTSNNTVYADGEGNIAYWHGNFMPRRNPALDWSKPVDGSTSATEWNGVHMVDEMVTLYNPASGWIQNCNQTPFSAAGESSPKRENYPPYMAPDEENFRGVNAVNTWSKVTALTIDKVIEGGYNRYLPFFESVIPALDRAWKTGMPIPDTLRMRMEQAVALLTNWDMRSDASSIATTLAIEWAQRLLPAIQATKAEEPDGDNGFVFKTRTFSRKASAADLLLPLRLTIDDLGRRFPGWQVPWGEINRYQRITGRLQETYSDTLPSIPVHFAAATWGALPSFVSRQMQGTRRRYGYSGNSFVCAVEFGEKVKAKSLLTGGNSGNPKSKHFSDQAEMYAQGQFKDVLFYREDVMRNKVRQYKPGLPKGK